METSQGHSTFKFTARHLIEMLGVSLVIVLALLLLPHTGQGSSAYPYPALKPPDPPRDLKAEAGVDNIELTWYPSPSAGLRGYWVYRGTEANLSHPEQFTLAYPAPLTGDRWIDPPRGYTNTLEHGVNYYYYLWAVNVNGQKSANFSNISNSSLKPADPPPPDDPPPPARRGELRIFMPDSGAPNGQTITVPVKIGNADGLIIDSMDVWVVYNQDVITATTIQRAPLLVEYDYAFQSNIIGESGVGAAAAAVYVLGPDDPKPTLFGEATLFEVSFQVLGSAGVTTAMDLPLTFTIGTDIYGTTIYTDVALPDIPLVRQSGTFTVTVPKIEDPPSYLMGDVFPSDLGDGQLTAGDVTEAMALAVANRRPNARQKQVGDMNGDERLNSADAALIRRQAGGLLRIFSARATQLLRSWMLASAASPVTVTVGSATGMPGAQIDLPINITNAADASSVDLMLNLDPQVLALNNVSLGSLPGLGTNFGLTFTQGATQTVKIALVPKPEMPGATIGGSGTGVLLRLDLSIKPTAPGGWSPVTLASVRLGDRQGQDFATSNLQVPVAVRNGRVGTFKIYLPVVLKNL
ncbi:MAG: hypothetical protein JW850_09975 [Thermoflexales bacterium]|nr:hypothetical protein [Thermoflexales bacterium]